MTTALIALLSAVLAALLTAYLGHARWLRERRMDIYVDFLGDLHDRRDALIQEAYSGGFGPPPPDDYLSPLYDRLQRVVLIGPTDTGRSARRVYEALSDLMNAGTKTRDAATEAVVAATDDFSLNAHRDLTAWLVVSRRTKEDLPRTEGA